MTRPVNTVVFKGLTRPVLKGGIPYGVFLILSLSLPILIAQTGKFIMPAVVLGALYAAAWIATIKDEHYLSEFLVTRLLTTRSPIAWYLHEDSIG